MTEKYTKEFVAELKARYAEANGNYEAEQAVLAEIEAEGTFTVKELRAKLAREGVYNAKAATKAEAVTKAMLVAVIAEKLGVTEEVAESLEKANKAVLKRLVMAL